MQQVIVIGGANVDIKGRSTGPLVPGSSNPGHVTVSAGGVGRNIAENLARLDVDTALLTVVGRDANGRLVRDACQAAGVDTRLMTEGDAPTGVYLAVLTETGEMTVAVNDMRSAEALTPALLERHAATLTSARLLVADCNLPVESLQWLCALTARENVPLLVEPISVAKAKKLLTIDRPKPVFAITPNRQQLEALTGAADIISGISRLHSLGFANVIVHAGRDGVTVSDSKMPPEHVPALAGEDIADVTGAGDAAVAGLICGLLDGLSLADAARMGQAAAALKLRSYQSVTQAMNRGSVLALSGLKRTSA